MSGFGTENLRPNEYTMQEADGLHRIYEDQKRIIISLEAVVFEDGNASGPDIGNWIIRWKAYADAERDVALAAMNKQTGEFRAAASAWFESASIQAKSLFKNEIPAKQALLLGVNHVWSYDEIYPLMRGYHAMSFKEMMDHHGTDSALEHANRVASTAKHFNIHRKEIVDAR